MSGKRGRNARRFLLDIGGEGRHPRAWNLNPSRVKTLGREAGRPIPRLIVGRSDAIPLADGCVTTFVVERTPLRRRALCELARVAAPHAVIILRHARPAWSDPHRLARAIFGLPRRQRMIELEGVRLQESVFRRPDST
jgi:hypothetical protein